jgi:DNA-binding helix-hairpin-helix protein with protein kinase domain
VAKVYYERPLAEEQVAKLQAMIAMWSSALESISAWPRAMLFDPTSRKPVGILIKKVVGARHLHELYGTTNRRRHFPDAAWHHLALAARNTAAAFSAVHAAGVVVGDVNQGNLMVDPQMCVRMIDCDSFQISKGDKTFRCPVGTPHFTPPELQSKKLSGVTRTVEHDCFGLAVLIFHLLFVGRHPFAGRYQGTGDLTIEKAIAERRFAFSKNRDQTLVEPPPASLLITDLPPAIRDLFEAAFRGPENAPRPTPLEWMNELDVLIKRRRTCLLEPSHVYSLDAPKCPWCRIEDAGGPTLFGSIGGTLDSAKQLAALDEKIFMLTEVRFPFLSKRELALPTKPKLRTLKHRTKLNAADGMAILLVAAWLMCVAGAVLGTAATLAIGVTISIPLVIALIVGKSPRGNRRKVIEYEAGISRQRESLERCAETAYSQHQQREVAFERATEDINLELQNYRNANQDLQSILVQHHQSQKTDYLRSFIIRDNHGIIRGLNINHVAILESYGIESANDLERIKLYGIPGIGPQNVTELLQWRQNVERRFALKPEHKINLADGSAAIQQFKISQARNILAAAKQLETLAEVAESELACALDNFKRESDQWSAVARELRDFQSSRRSFERIINRSPARIVGLAVAAASVTSLLYWMLN